MSRWWDRGARLAIALVAAYIILSIAGWRPLRGPWEMALTTVVLAYWMAWTVRTMFDLRAMERDARRRQAQFDAMLRDRGERR